MCHFHRWRCNICYRVNDLPEEFLYDPVSKSYGDPSRRPECKVCISGSPFHCLCYIWGYSRRVYVIAAKIPLYISPLLMHLFISSFYANLKSSTIEFIAPSEYMLRPPQPAVYIFLLDVSRQAVETGYVKALCNVLLEELDKLPGDSRTQVKLVISLICNRCF